MGEVELGAQCAGDLRMLRELFAVVCSQRVHTLRMRQQQAQHRALDAIGVLARQFGD